MNKLFNKILMTALLTGLLTSVSSAELKSRTFLSADKSKSFEGTLTAYNGEDNKVRVRTSKGRDITFKLSVLSEKCQAYVTENASMVAVASSLDISFEKVKEKKVKGADGVNTTFDVIFYNRSKTIIKGMVIDYTVYYSKDTLNNGKRTTSKLTSTGSFDVYDLDPRYRTTETTQTINIVNKTIAGKGGG
ncbi:MAG: hypothetical protein ACI9SQ_000751 [Rubritalea sp.]|jgi:hypothetical protein